MKFAQSSAVYYNYSLKYAIQDLGRIGYDGIEIWGGRPHMYRQDLDEQLTDILSLLEKYDLAKYIRHGTGHAHGIMIGSAGREEKGELRIYNKTLLAPNMANSVEPGVYIPGVGGFRHSDVLIVTETGARCITDFPRDIGV